MAPFINLHIVAPILGWFGGSAPAGFWVGYLVAALIHVTLLLGLVATAALVFIWLERKLSGRIQDRLGPTRVGGMFGWLQTLADGVKLITKEDLMPAAADWFLFKIAPYISFAASFTCFLALPFASGPVAWVGQHLNVGLFFVLAVLGLEVFGVILGGYASGSKWSLFGAMREAAQVVSYEVPLGLCAVVPVMITGTMDLVAIGDMQQGLASNWLIFHDPFAFITFWVFFTCATAGVNRAPFDLAEAESELVAGFLTEYSGLRWSIFFMAEYGSMLAVSILAAILFLGAWNGPIPVFGPQMLDWAQAPGAAGWTLTGYLASLAGCLNLLAKGVTGVAVMMWARWTLPRLRIDQVIVMCWKYCTPIACFTFIGTTVWMLIWPAGMGLLPAAPRPKAAVREAAPAGQAILEKTRGQTSIKGTRVQSPESRVQGPESRDQRPGTRDQGPESRDQSPGTRVQGPESRDQGPESRDQGPESRVQGPEPIARTILHLVDEPRRKLRAPRDEYKRMHGSRRGPLRAAIRTALWHSARCKPDSRASIYPLGPFGPCPCRTIACFLGVRSEHGDTAGSWHLLFLSELLSAADRVAGRERVSDPYASGSRKAV